MKNKFILFLILSLSIFISFSGCLDVSQHNYDNSDDDFISNHEYFYADVVKVVDGDTVYVVAENGTEYKLRLLGVDTPETYRKNSPNEYMMADGRYISNITYLKMWGIYAKDYAKKELDGKKVIVVFDNRAPKKDRYNRYLTYVFVDGENFNENLIKYGYARVYISNFELKEKFLEEEKYAKEHRIGMWNYSDNN
jgi:micrococcal nuclease